MNTHPLTDDMRMYYSGTYIFREHKGVIQCMYVESTERIGDDRMMDGFEFIGPVSDHTGSDGEFKRWLGSDMIQYRPLSGYYDLDGSGVRDKYVTIALNNRTQRKGLDRRNVMVNGVQGEISPRQLCRMFAQSEELCSQPKARDTYVDGDKAYWKGNLVGTIDGDKLVVLEPFDKMEGFLCQLLLNT